MKRFVDFLLFLVLALTVGYIVYAMRDGQGLEPAGPTPATRPAPTQASGAPVAPAIVPTFTLLPASVTIPTRTATLTPLPTRTPTRTPAASLTPLPSSTPTAGPTLSPQDPEINDGIERGNVIIRAIEAYHADQGHYPSTLGILVPDYLAEVPVTVTDQAFMYRLFDGTGPLSAEVYWLAFKVLRRAHTSCTYYRRLDYWDCNYASP
jgi:hypothetical protein